MSLILCPIKCFFSPPNGWELDGKVYEKHHAVNAYTIRINAHEWNAIQYNKIMPLSLLLALTDLTLQITASI